MTEEVDVADWHERTVCEMYGHKVSLHYGTCDDCGEVRDPDARGRRLTQLRDAAGESVRMRRLLRAGVVPADDPLGAVLPGDGLDRADVRDVEAVNIITGRDVRDPSAAFPGQWQAVNVARLRAALRRWALVQAWEGER